jgi:putative acetyltransferase
MHKYRIHKYTDDFKTQILNIWEKAVFATHEFLDIADFKEIKEEVNIINFNDFQVYCITEKTLVLGFIGVAENKIEMLFLDPEYFGLGIGLKLLEFAVNDLEADKVDVNEQNEKAINF